MSKFHLILCDCLLLLPISRISWVSEKSADMHTFHFHHVGVAVRSVNANETVLYTDK